MQIYRGHMQSLVCGCLWYCLVVYTQHLREGFESAKVWKKAQTFDDPIGALRYFIGGI